VHLALLLHITLIHSYGVDPNVETVMTRPLDYANAYLPACSLRPFMKHRPSIN
jgi:hypothetical protein